jgi:hypothetical protein
MEGKVLDKMLDKRLQRRLERLQKSSGQSDREASQLPDLADRIAPPSDEELEELKRALIAERPIREERVRRAVERQTNPEPEIEPVIPLDDEADFEPQR